MYDIDTDNHHHYYYYYYHQEKADKLKAEADKKAKLAKGKYDDGKKKAKEAVKGFLK